MYRRNRHRWVRLAYAIGGHRCHCEDVVAEAVAKVWPHFLEGRVDDVTLYMRRAVINEAMGQGRRQDMRARILARRAAPPMQAAVEESVEHHQLLVDGLFRLPADQRAVIALRFLEDLSEAETASVLGVRVGTVKSRVHRGLQALRQVLEGVGVDGR